MVRVSELRVGDYIRASWLGSGWHKVLEVGTSDSDSSNVYLAVEGFRGVEISADETVERQ